jgi:hypothetical protein
MQVNFAPNTVEFRALHGFAERTKQGGEAKGRMDARDCEGHRHSQSGPQKQAERDAEGLWRIAAPSDAALELTGLE